MVNIKMLTAVAAIATLGVAAPVAAEEATPATTIHEESPRAGTGVSVGSDPNAVKHNRGEVDDANGNDSSKVRDNVDANGDVPGADDAVHNSAYKKTYPEEPEVSELDE